MKSERQFVLRLLQVVQQNESKSTPLQYVSATQKCLRAIIETINLYSTHT